MCYIRAPNRIRCLAEQPSTQISTQKLRAAATRTLLTTACMNLYLVYAIFLQK